MSDKWKRIADSWEEKRRLYSCAGPYRSAPDLPNPEPRDIYAKLEAIAKAQDEARHVLDEQSRALTALLRELASLKDGAADAATHCDDGHEGKVA